MKGQVSRRNHFLKRYNYNKANNLCAKCGETEPVKDKTLCPKCAKINKSQAKKYRDTHKFKRIKTKLKEKGKGW